MQILLSAYACEPGKGSEPGVGWRWVCGLAGRVSLTVVTRSNNRTAIEAELVTLPENDPVRRVCFLYHDLPTPFRRLKRAGLLPTLPYYFLWQWTASRRFSRRADASDIVHHLTFCTALCPGFWNRTKAARVIGPVAAPIVPDAYLPLFGTRRITQSLRNHIIRNFLRLPWLQRSFTGAAAVFPANSDMKHLLETLGVSSQEVMLDTGSPDLPANQQSKIKNHQSSITDAAACHFLYAGVLERRKGLELALRAFAQVVDMQGTEDGEQRTEDGEQKTEDGEQRTEDGEQRTEDGAREAVNAAGQLQSPIHNPPSTIHNLHSFTLLGDGPDRARLESLAASLGISDHVHFPGRVSHADVSRYFRDADVFVFTSVRDASGGVNLEAMVQGLPILCLAHQGVGDITDEYCAIRIRPGPIPETIAALAESMSHLVNDPALRRKMGGNARTRALENFSWQAKFDRMIEIYQKIVQ